MIRQSLTKTLILILPLTWGLVGCGGGGGGGGAGAGGAGKSKESAPPVKPAGGGDSGTASSSNKTETAPSGGGAEGWGTIKGQIVWDGAIPAAKELVKKGDNDAKDAATCAAEGVMSEEVVVNKDNNGLRWVIVYIGGKPKIHPDLKNAEGTAEIGQKGCHFIPHVLAMRQGQKFVITSDDPVAHNTKGDGFKNPSFNPVVPAAEGGRSHLDGPELVAENLPINVSCSIHQYMKAYIGVYNHPYFAVTDENGNFTIEKVPAGDQKLNIWHEKGYGEGGKDGKAITVKADDTTDLGKIKYTAK
jgi:hypothetical protein